MGLCILAMVARSLTRSEVMQSEEAQEIVKALHRGLAIVRAAQAAVPLEFPTFQSLQETMTFYQPRLCKDGRLEDWAVKNGWCVAPTEGSASE